MISDLKSYLNQALAQVYFFSSHVTKLYTETQYSSDDWLVFGSETTGLPEELHHLYSENFRTIPMKPGSRCLNLATSAGIALFEVVRQVGLSATAS